MASSPSKKSPGILFFKQLRRKTTQHAEVRSVSHYRRHGSQHEIPPPRPADRSASDYIRRRLLSADSPTSESRVALASAAGSFLTGHLVVS